MGINVILFQIYNSSRDQLTVLEKNIEISFYIARVYYMYSTLLDVIRDKYSHKGLQQILFCIYCFCRSKFDDGYSNDQIGLNIIKEDILMTNNMWREMFDFFPNVVVLVSARELYYEFNHIKNSMNSLNI